MSWGLAGVTQGSGTEPGDKGAPPGRFPTALGARSARFWDISPPSGRLTWGRPLQKGCH